MVEGVHVLGEDGREERQFALELVYWAEDHVGVWDLKGAALAEVVLDVHDDKGSAL